MPTHLDPRDHARAAAAPKLDDRLYHAKLRGRLQDAKRAPRRRARAAGEECEQLALGRLVERHRVEAQRGRGARCGGGAAGARGGADLCR